jgi:SAM-dependent methyltransferase
VPFCAICERNVPNWLPHPQREAAAQLFTRLVGSIGSNLDWHLCPACGCNDRERHLVLYLQAEGIFERLADLRILHMAPEFNLERRIRALQPREYICGDLMPNRPELRKLDVEALPFDDDAFDLIMCNHVLEHVADPDRAMRELRRCLSDEGHLVAQTPYSPNLKLTLEMIHPVTPEFANHFYGQDDHVRLFGADLPGRFRAAGLVGDLLPHEEVLPDFPPEEYGINPREPFFLFRKHA